MKILFIRHHDKSNINTRSAASIDRSMGVIPPLGIAYVAGTLRSAGYEVKIADSQALNLTTRDLRDRIKAESPNIVGITATTPSIHGALEAARIAKECGTKVVLGGPHLNVFPEETLSYNFIDYGINGEGEYSMLKLVKALERGDSFENIPGLIFRKNEKIISNAPEIIKDLDQLHLPARELLPLDKYFLIDALRPFATIVTMRGCAYRCGYCIKSDFTRVVRFRNPLLVADEIQMLVDKYHIKEINFVDDTITYNRKHTVQLCEEILKRKIKVAWQGPTRVNRIDFELLKLMKEAGCRQLRFGIESGNQEILDLMKKDITLEMCENALRWTKKLKIKTVCYFIIGYVRETPQTMRRTIDFAKKLNPDAAMFYVGTPLPKTDFYRLALEEGLVKENYWRDFVLEKCRERLPFMVKDAPRWLNKAFHEFYFRPRFLLNKLTQIRSVRSLYENIRAAFSIFLFKLSEKVKFTD
jgi:radical SAM superfamily enzyme YgiQ (UPF0313 family)